MRAMLCTRERTHAKRQKCEISRCAQQSGLAGVQCLGRRGVLTDAPAVRSQKTFAPLHLALQGLYPGGVVFFLNFIYLFMAVLGLRFCARAFSSRGKRGPLLIAVRRPLTIAAPPVAEHRLQTRRLSNCGSRAQLLRGMWDPPRPGLEPASPALAGRLSTTAPPGKPWWSGFKKVT